MHGIAIQHSRLADRKIGNINHFLHFAIAFGLDLAHFERDQASQRVLVIAQGIADVANGIAANRCMHLAPFKESVPGVGYDFLVFVCGRGSHACDNFAG